jgi:two-component system, NtrC family, sensor histidine kinase PilS
MMVASPARWGELRLFALVRLVIAGALVVLGWTTPQEHSVDFFQLAMLGVASALASLIAASLWRKQFNVQLAVATLIDLAVLTGLIYLSSGLRGGLSVMCVASVAGAAVLAPPNLARFFAASASLMLLLGAVLQVLSSDTTEAQTVFQAGVVGLACFAMAEIIHRLAQHSARQQALAEQRGLDLREQLALTRLALAEVPQAVLVVGPQGDIQLSNPAAHQLLQPAATSGASAETLSGSAAGRVVEASMRALQANAGARHEQPHLELPGPDLGASIPVRMRMHAAGERSQIVVLEDQRLVRQQAEQLKLAAMGRLSAGIAHEIRNPLAAIRHANSLLVESPGQAAGSAMHKRMHQIIETNAVRIDRIVEDVLSLARQEPISDQQADAQPVLQLVLADLALQHPEQCARIELRAAGSELVAFSADHLRQVVVNLLNNALRYASSAPGAVQLGLFAAAQADCIELCVADDGPGLTPQARQHLFEPFFTTSPSGTGLGLSLARQICELNGAVLLHREPAQCLPGRHEFVVVMRRAAQ